MTTKTEYGSRLSKILADADEPQVALAERVGISVQMLSHIVTGIRYPSWPTHSRIVEALREYGATDAQVLWLCTA